MNTRFDRQELFIDQAGQQRLERARVTIVGVGGLGSHVLQQLAYLGVRNITLIDDDKVELTNLNRLVGATMHDLGRPKVATLAESASLIDESLKIVPFERSLITHEAFEAVRSSDYVIGCLDNDGPRFILNRLAAAYGKPLTDLATEIGRDRRSYGGRIVYCRPGKGCLMCRDAKLLDQGEIRAWLRNPQDEAFARRVYGQTVAQKSPAVVSLNGVLASIAVTELLLEIAGVREAYEYLEYKGPFGAVRNHTPMHEPSALESCYTCQNIAGKGERAGVESEFLS